VENGDKKAAHWLRKRSTARRSTRGGWKECPRNREGKKRNVWGRTKPFEGGGKTAPSTSLESVQLRGLREGKKESAPGNILARNSVDLRRGTQAGRRRKTPHKGANAFFMRKVKGTACRRHRNAERAGWGRGKTSGEGGGGGEAYLIEGHSAAPGVGGTSIPNSCTKKKVQGFKGRLKKKDLRAERRFFWNARRTR